MYLVPVFALIWTATAPRQPPSAIAARRRHRRARRRARSTQVEPAQGDAMRIGYLIDTNLVRRGPPAADAGGDRRRPRRDGRGGRAGRARGLSLRARARPPRRAGVRVPGARAAAHAARARDLARDARHVHVRGHARAPDEGRRAVRGDRQPVARPARDDGLARLPVAVLGPVRDPGGAAARALPGGAAGLARGVRGRALRLRRRPLDRCATASSRRRRSRTAAGRSGAAATRHRRRSGAPRLRRGVDVRPDAARARGVPGRRRRLPRAGARSSASSRSSC